MSLFDYDTDTDTPAVKAAKSYLKNNTVEVEPGKIIKELLEERSNQAQPTITLIECVGDVLYLMNSDRRYTTDFHECMHLLSCAYQDSLTVFPMFHSKLQRPEKKVV